MKPKILVVAACVCLTGLVALALAQAPVGTEPAAPQNNPPTPGGGVPAAIRTITIKANDPMGGETNELTTQKLMIDIPQRPGAGGADYQTYVVYSNEPSLSDNQQKLLRQWKKAESEPERDKIKEQLRELLTKQFEARLAAQDKEVSRLEARVKRLREQVELRRQKQSDIVGFRLEQLLRDAQGLGWGAQEINPAGAGPRLGAPLASPYGGFPKMYGPHKERKPRSPQR